MTINYTTLLGLAQPVTGTEAGTWGTTVNDSITALLEDAVANAVSISVTAGNVTLTTTQGASNQARMAILLVTGSAGTSRNIVAPSQSKWYIVRNNSDSSIVIKGSATAGVTMNAGTDAIVYWNGSDFEIAGMNGPLSSTDNAIARFDGTTGKLVQDSSVFISDNGVLQFTSAVTGSTTLSTTNPALVYSAGVTYTDTNVSGGTKPHAPFWSLLAPTLTNSTTATTYTNASTLYIGGPPAASTNITITNPYALYVDSGNVYLGGGTANGVAYLNASKVLTTGSALTFDGTTLGVTNASASTALNATKSADGNTALFRRVGGTYNPGLYISLSDTVNNEIIFNSTYSSGNAPAYVWQQAGSEQMRLTSTGLGIGTSSPSVALQVQRSSANAAFRLSSSGGSGRDWTITSQTDGHLTVGSDLLSGQLDLYAGNLGLGVTPSEAFCIKRGASTSAYIEVAGNNNGVGTASVLYGQDSGNNGYYWNRSNAPILFGTNNIERARIDSSGNLGLGTASIGGGANDRQLTLAGTSSAQSSYTTNSTVTNSVGSNTTLGYVGTTTNHPFVFTTNNTERMRLDTSGNLGIGTSSPGVTLDVNGSTRVRSDFFVYAGGDRFNVFPASAGNGVSVVSTNNGNTGYSTLKLDGAPLIFNYAGSEVGRFDSSGNLLVGATSGVATGVTLNQNSGAATIQVGHQNGTSSGSSYSLYYYNSTQIGSITQNGTTGVLYNITSDYRLKTVIGPVTNASSRIDALKPIEYEWKSNGSAARGFLAHEFQEVYPNSVTGEKDSVDEDGNPVYQNMQASTSEVIADLVAEIQSLRIRITQLEAK